MPDQSGGFDWQVEDSPTHVHNEGCYRKVLDWIENNGIRDEHGGYRVSEDRNLTVFNIRGVLCPLRSKPSQYSEGRTVFQLYHPDAGTPAYHAWICWELSASSSRRDLKLGVELSERHFSAEAMRHLRLAAGEALGAASVPNRVRKPGRTLTPKGPAHKRLVIQGSHTGDDVARLDGKEYRLTGASDAKFLELLQERSGQTMLATTLEHECGERPARIYNRLPKPIQRIIDKPGRRTGKKGYRML